MEAKRKKIEQQLQLALQQRDEAKRKAEEESIQQPKPRIVHCQHCHMAKSEHQIVGKNGKTRHNCKAKGVPKCTSLAKCGYAAGHAKEASANKRIAKLETKKKLVDEAAAKQVRSLCVLLLTVLSVTEGTRRQAFNALG